MLTSRHIVPRRMGTTSPRSCRAASYRARPLSLSLEGRPCTRTARRDSTCPESDAAPVDRGAGDGGPSPSRSATLSSLTARNWAAVHRIAIRAVKIPTRSRRSAFALPEAMEIMERLAFGGYQRGNVFCSQLGHNRRGVCRHRVQILQLALRIRRRRRRRRR